MVKLIKKRERSILICLLILFSFINFSLIDGSITLNLPSDNYFSPTNQVTFNATINISTGATFVNKSLWTNKTGNFIISNTSNKIDLEYNTSFPGLGQNTDAFSSIKYIGNGIVLAGKRNYASYSPFSPIYRSTNYGVTWASINVTSITGVHIYQFEVNPNTGTVIAGTGDTGNICLIRSTDFGANWSVQLNTTHLKNLTNVSSQSSNGAIFAPLYLGNNTWIANIKNTESGATKFIIKSIDDGVTWDILTTSGLNAPARSMYLTSDGRIVYMGSFGTGNNQSIYISTDNGTTWNKTLPSVAIFSGFADMGNGVYVAGTYNNTGATYQILRIYRSTDYGATWNAVNTSFVVNTTLAYFRWIQKLNDNVVIAYASSSETTQTHRKANAFFSYDNGVNWLDYGAVNDSYGGLNAIYMAASIGNDTFLLATQPDSVILRSVYKDYRYEPLSLNFQNDGSYLWAMQTCDSYGNCSLSENRTLTIDTIYPSLDLTYPQNTTYNINVSSINYTISDTNLQACWYSLDFGVTNSTITCGTNLTGLTSSEGSNKWIIYANDSAGNLNSSNVTFFRDISPSLCSYTSVSSTSAIIYYNSSEPVNATLNYGTGTNLGTNASVVSLALNGSFALTILSPSTLYYYNITVCDSSGNCVTNSTLNFSTSSETASVVQTSGGGGGGGGGTTYDGGSLASAMIKELSIGDKISFSMDDKTGYYVSFSSMTGSSASVRIKTDTTLLTRVLSIGQSVQVDVNGDGDPDIEIILDNVDLKTTKANFEIKSLHTAAGNDISGGSQGNQSNEENNLGNETGQGQGNGEPLVIEKASTLSPEKLILILVGVVIILFIILIFYLKKN